MKTTFDIIKTTEFDTNGHKGTHYNCALNGHIVSVSTMDFKADVLTVDKTAKTLTIEGDIGLRKEPYVSDNVERIGYKVMLKVGLEII